MTEDEKVDGPRVAAQILNSMRASDRDKLFGAIQQKAPELALQIKVNLFTFEDIAELTTQGIQLLISQIEHKDLVLSLKKASQPLQNFFYENMSERKRASVDEDLKALPPTQISDVEDAQKRILRKLEELRTLGKVLTQGKHDTWV